MASYVIVGASRGLGFEFLRQLSADSSNIVIGLVRDVEAVKAKTAAEIERPNVHLLHYDLDDSRTLPGIVKNVSNITGGRVDHLIANAGVGGDVYHLPIGEFAKDADLLDQDFTKTFRTNVVGNAQVIGAFMPLILAGQAKKVIAILSGMGDIDLTRHYDLWMATAYSVAKAALSMVIAKYSAQYREQGVMIFGVSPGIVDTGFNATEEQLKVLKVIEEKLATYEPSFKGPITPEESVTKVLALLHQSSVADEYAGDFISHHGTKRWL